MTEPTTDEGKALATRWPEGFAWIITVEAEARAAALADLRTEVEALLATLAAVPHDDHASPCTACLRDGFARTLDLLSP